MTTSRNGAPHELGPMPTDRRMTTVDERLVRAPLPVIFPLAAQVEDWPTLLPHYRFVRFEDRRADGGGLVEMSANRPFGVVDWPTYWASLMSVTAPGSTLDRSARPSIRFRHIRGVTTGMDVEWAFEPRREGRETYVRIVHVWQGPAWPVIGEFAARGVIGPIFVHGIAARTLAGLALVAEGRADPALRAHDNEVSSG